MLLTNACNSVFPFLPSEAIMKRATNVARKNLISVGTCIGKFTKSKKFHMQITALDVIAPYAKVLVYVFGLHVHIHTYAGYCVTLNRILISFTKLLAILQANLTVLASGNI